MGPFAVGDVVAVIFPYADLSAFKRRPALIVGQAEFGNYITCQITSKAKTSKRAVRISNSDFREGTLKVESYVRPDKIFSLEPSLIQTKLGSISHSKQQTVKAAVRKLFL